MTSALTESGTWQQVTLQKIFEIRAAGDIDWSKWRREKDQRYPYPVYANGRANSGLHGYASYAVEAGNAVTLTARGTIGELGYAFFRAKSFTPIGRLLVLRPKQGVEALFYASYINSRVRFAQENTGVAQLTAPQISQVVLDLPPLPEQVKIAAVLKDVDALLNSLDRLIAKKRDLKQAAMQQLLTGQTRLPGFSGEWEVKRLGDVGRLFKGSGVTKDQTRSGTLACVRYGELYTQHNYVIQEFYSWISPAVAATAVKLKQGDILFAGSGETKEEIGKCAAFVGGIEAYAGGDIVILRPENSDSHFLGYYLNTAAIVQQKASRGQGDAVVHINSSALSNVMCKLPPVREQAAVAEVLNKMDIELHDLHKRRNKTAALKQGMMQELLTGRTRLV
ncbi:restriction endonuclease subunit S [Burkholderiaceae bacterium]|nr:restriction endonuclease subunit S [Burkholderiaceae bacterium]